MLIILIWHGTHFWTLFHICMCRDYSSPLSPLLCPFCFNRQYHYSVMSSFAGFTHLCPYICILSFWHSLSDKGVFISLEVQVCFYPLGFFDVGLRLNHWSQITAVTSTLKTPLWSVFNIALSSHLLAPPSHLLLSLLPSPLCVAPLFAAVLVAVAIRWSPHRYCLSPVTPLPRLATHPPPSHTAWLDCVLVSRVGV